MPTLHDLDPAIGCTRMQLGFAAWQRAQGRSDLSKTGVAWEAFCAWWEGRDLVYFTSMRQLARAAWNASSGEFESQLTSYDDRVRFDAWWSSLIERARRLASHAQRTSEKTRTMKASEATR